MLLKITLPVLVVALAYFYYRSPREIEGKTIATKSGSVKGIVSLSRDGREYYEWLGIPYAKPPLGKLRFESPQPVDPWKGIKDTSRYGSKCAQLEALTYRPVGNEDCLFLNIHVPKTPRAHGNLPVLVSVHGGGFNVGSSNDFRPDYFMDEDVVLVTMNYRLGVFGFLSTGDATIRGNMGLKDLVLSLQWIKDNIEAFGGDPNQITIFGESAGGASVHYLLLSPRTRGLFQKAISQSGVATQPWAFDTPQGSKSFLEKYAQGLNCPAGASAQLAECLRSLSFVELLQNGITDMQTDFVTHPQKNGYLLRPTIEGVHDSEAFLTEHPFQIISEGRASKVPWMTGVTADEGLLSSVEFYKDDQHMKEYEEAFDKLIFETFGISETSLKTEIAKQVKDFYFPRGFQTPTQQKRDKFTKMFSDAHFNVQMSRTVSIQRKFAPVYLYYYNKTGGPSLAPLLAGIKGNYPLLMELMIMFVKDFVNEILFGVMPKDYGVCHGDDLAMQFYMPYIFNVKKDSTHYNFSKDIVAFWVDFARESTANFRGVKVPLVKPDGKLQYLEINDSPKIIQEPFQDRLSFLTKLSFHKR